MELQRNNTLLYIIHGCVVEIRLLSGAYEGSVANTGFGRIVMMAYNSHQMLDIMLPRPRPT